jgi:hypothetical protein
LDRVTDLTINHFVDVSATPEPDSAMAVGAAPTIPAPQFAKVTSTKVQVNGQYLDFLPSTQYNQLNGAETLVKSSAIASPGDSFSLTFKHAS